MRKTIFVLLVVLGLSFCFVTAKADTFSTPEDFYRTCIEKKIVRCEQKAKLLQSKGENLKREGEKARRELTFYENRKEELVRQMALEKVGRNQKKVDYLLIKAYNDFNGSMITDNR